MQSDVTHSPIVLLQSDTVTPPPPGRHEELIRAATKMFERYNVTHFYTLTYGARISLIGRMHHFHEWVDALEWQQARPLGWLRADEMKRYSGCGYPDIPEHHHGLLIGADHLDCCQAESIWHSIAGDAEVRRYYPHGGAIQYSLKHAFHRVGDWEMGPVKGFVCNERRDRRVTQ